MSLFHDVIGKIIVVKELNFLFPINKTVEDKTQLGLSLRLSVFCWGDLGRKTMASVLPFVRGVDFSQSQFPVSSVMKK